MWTKLVGVTFGDRQERISELKGLETLEIVREKNNEYDPNAVGVRVFGDRALLGYFAREIASKLAPKLDEGESINILGFNITGGMDDRNWGVNINIETEEEEQITVEKNDLVKMYPTIGDGYVWFNEKTHKFYNERYEPMTSGSVMEKGMQNEFPAEILAKKLEDKTGVYAGTIQQIWENNGKISAELGTAIHDAMDFWIKNYRTIAQLDGKRDRTVECKNYMPEIIANVLDPYWEDKDPTTRTSEVFVRYGNYCGFIDQLVENDDGTLTIRDYKIVKKLGKVKYNDLGSKTKYTVQQNFYADILELNGKRVKSIYLDVYKSGKWEEVELERVRLLEKNDK